MGRSFGHRPGLPGEISEQQPLQFRYGCLFRGQMKLSMAHPFGALRPSPKQPCDGLRALRPHAPLEFPLPHSRPSLVSTPCLAVAFHACLQAVLRRSVMALAKACQAGAKHQASWCQHRPRAAEGPIPGPILLRMRLFGTRGEYGTGLDRMPRSRPDRAVPSPFWAAVAAEGREANRTRQPAWECR